MTPPPRDELFDALGELTLFLAGSGIFNYLLSNGDGLFAHCSTELSYIIRCAPFAEAHLKDEDVRVDFSRLTTLGDRMAVIATQPLTDNEIWQTMSPGTLWLFHHGQVSRRMRTRASPIRSIAESRSQG